MTYEKLLNADPCQDGADWLLEQQNAGLTLAEAWATCPRADWMLWALDEFDIELNEEQNLRLQLQALETPIGGGRTVLDLITDERSWRVINLKRRQLSGEQISAATWAAAREGALNAVKESIHEPTAVWYALWAVALCAASDTLEVVWSLARDAAQETARETAHVWQADKIREIVGNPFQEEVS